MTIEQLAADPDVRQALAQYQPVTPSSAQKKSDACRRAALTRWKNPRYHAHMVKMRQGRKYPKQGASMKARWSDPHFRAKMVAACRASIPKIKQMAVAREALKKKRYYDNLRKYRNLLTAENGE